MRRVIAGYEQARRFSLANYDELKRIFIGVTGLDSDVVDKQLKERTELTHNKVGPAQRESITTPVSSRAAVRARLVLER